MNKLIALLLTLLLAVTSALAEDATADLAELDDLSGLVTEMTEDYIAITTPEGQPIHVLLTAETEWIGKAVALGDFIHVTYNGIMTRSFPAQVTALTIGCYAQVGSVEAIGEDSFTLKTENDEIIVNATAEQLAQLAVGMTVTVYTNGVMTMSLPAIVTAELIRPTLVGTVVEAFITVETADGQLYQVNLSDLTVLTNGLPSLGDTLLVGYNGQMTKSIPAQVHGDYLEVRKTVGNVVLMGEVVEFSQDGILVRQENGVEVLVLPSQETAMETVPAVGQTIEVLYNGIMTLSLPGQVNAIAITVMNAAE